jgi:hypothetical protein
MIEGTLSAGEHRGPMSKFSIAIYRNSLWLLFRISESGACVVAALNDERLHDKQHAKLIV